MTLSVWTQHLKDLNVVNNFHPCYSSTPQKVISAGPGVTVGELYDYAERNGLLVMGGYTATIGAAGGFIIGGGIGK
jgi:FAD/FMN-containing dehydrogenase